MRKVTVDYVIDKTLADFIERFTKEYKCSVNDLIGTCIKLHCQELFAKKEFDKWSITLNRLGHDNLSFHTVGLSPSRGVMWTYVMKTNIEDVYKIGRSRNVKQREYTLRHQYPNLGIQLLYQKIGDHELLLHERFESLRYPIERNTEFFKIDRHRLYNVMRSELFTKVNE